MNIPNSLSLLRLLIVVPFLVAILYQHYFTAFIIFGVAGFSDVLDGYLARRLAQQSTLGSFLDPLGDKLLNTVAFIALGSQDLLPAWLAVVVVAKDLYISLGAALLYLAGRLDTATPNLWGKLSTLMQCLAIGIALLSALVPIHATLAQVFFGLTGVVATLAGVSYFLRDLKDIERKI